MSLKLVQTPLSNIDLNDLLKDINNENGEKKHINIMTVPDMIANPKKVIKFLNKDKYLIVFIENKGEAVGHWVVLFKSGNTINLFDSYGQHSDELDKRLTTFLKKHFKNVRYNTFQYQKDGDKIATCGRYSMFVIGCKKILGEKLTLEKIKEILDGYKKLLKKNDYDKIMASLINFDL